MIPGPQLYAGLESAVEAARDAARQRGAPAFTALRVPLPPEAADPFEGAPGERFLLDRPAEGLSIRSRGAAAVVETRGGGRFREAARQARELFSALHVAGDAGGWRGGPYLVGGFTFSDDPTAEGPWRAWAPGRLVLPRRLRIRRGGSSWRCEVAAVLPDSDVAELCRELRARSEAPAASRGGDALETADEPAPDYRLAPQRSLADYRARVALALEAIAAGELEKVVIAREVQLSGRCDFPTAELLRSLRSSYPTCASFALGREDATFLGATPERLVRVCDGRVETAAVAGSAPRGRGPEEDERLARELRESKKEQAEHEIVVRALRRALAGSCEGLAAPESPRVLRLEGIQHLETPIRGRLRPGVSLLDLVGRLHPTPAVAGEPRERALEWLGQEEQLSRGLYAGPVGFLAPDGEGEFVVALRSALIRGAEAFLYAGAGIVAGSRPEAELRETRLKLRALLLQLLEI